ncbi:MAG: threonylcarbamoyl-AMP synthase [Candidatus Nealsonbacteria bacterium RIFOXYB1_FULL_40_15]|uniref:L-threonylcarbamoyladenylate synthase n=2 Tax=Candidatus Nealsoniibacteriota TaxID=1817911 RepID=A0A1G2ESA4_9BACT|nr:MAG: threonylcarbamoyl-AMP synthase [Candidatus Nealsonbacteria bacterium RIFOXYB1_FULL_40_15]OGZ28459.1 MAG: threonylcarbamoyl-AMP synthase [Candidatus Nealsonbacteria bacterium RIFOXYD1_FULL_39_11]OGZ28653.1 MAG: threonylcarbamoyl-AMP synthase [Candidatus Nealsonbacteria bacterium RIFOXYC1_FULL_40_7]
MPIDKVVIAAAGEGTRMLHLTANKSKHLIKVRKRPFLAYLLDNLFLAGYRDLILVTGYKEELIEEFLRKYKPPFSSIKYSIRTLSQYEKLGPKSVIYGTACPLMVSEEAVGKESFVYLCGDNLYSVQDLKEMRNGGKYNYVAGVYKKNPEKYGVLIQEGEFLEKIVEKPKEFLGNMVNAGLYKFTSEVFEKIKKIKKSSRGEYEITDAVSMLAKEKKVKVKVIKDFWFDFGNPADIIMLSYFLSSIKRFKKIFGRNRKFEVISARSRDAVERAVEYLKRGQVLACPTDTVYGLIADATNEKAVQRVFEIKQRDKKKPLPVFVKDIGQAKKLAAIDNDTEAFLEEIWPGKITAALERKKNSGIAPSVYVEKNTIALRIPDSKFVKDIMDKFQKPLTATSANPQGIPSTVKINDIFDYFEDSQTRPDLVVDAGDLPDSNPSTIIDFSQKRPKIIRRGK